MAGEADYRTEKLVTLAKAGDESAFEQLYKTYGEHIRRIMRLRMGNELRSKLESMDLVHDAFISALRGLDNFTYKNEGDFLRWVSQIAENRIRDNLDKFHADKRDIRKEIPLSNNRRNDQETVSIDLSPRDTTTPSMIMSKSEDLNKLEDAIDRLKPEYKEVIKLSKIEGLSYEEIARRTERTPDAVRMLLSRAMAALTDIFGEI